MVKRKCYQRFEPILQVWNCNINILRDGDNGGLKRSCLEAHRAGLADHDILVVAGVLGLVEVEAIVGLSEQLTASTFPLHRSAHALGFNQDQQHVESWSSESRYREVSCSGKDLTKAHERCASLAKRLD